MFFNFFENEEKYYWPKLWLSCTLKDKKKWKKKKKKFRLLVSCFVFLYLNTSVKRQKGGSQIGGNKKAKHPKFSKKRTFLTPWYVPVGEKSCFSENLACFAFFLPSLWDLPFCLITDENTWAIFSLYKRISVK